MSMRERNKLATRQALSWAALHLAIERGLKQVRIEDIAAAAGVSVRTFTNYFPSKEAAIVAIGADRADRIVAALRARSPDEGLWVALTHAVTEQFAEEPDREWLTQVRLITDTPALHGEYLKSGAAIAEVIAVAIAERTGTDPERDLFPQLAAAAVVTAEQVAINFWLTSRPDAPLAAVVRSVLDQISAGLPPPGNGARDE
jgi:AcrR family transcriptional regulator